MTVQLFLHSNEFVFMVFKAIFDCGGAALSLGTYWKGFTDIGNSCYCDLMVMARLISFDRFFLLAEFCISTRAHHYCECYYLNSAVELCVFVF